MRIHPSGGPSSRRPTHKGRGAKDFESSRGIQSRDTPSQLCRWIPTGDTAGRRPPQDRYKYSFLTRCTSRGGGRACAISSGSEIRSNEHKPAPLQGAISGIRYSLVSSNQRAITSTRSVPSGSGFASLSINSEASMSPCLMYLRSAELTA